MIARTLSRVGKLALLFSVKADAGLSRPITADQNVGAGLSNRCDTQKSLHILSEPFA